MAGKEIEYQNPEIECLEREDILAIQAQKLGAMGRRLADRPEWRDHLGKAGMKPGDLADFNAFTSLPTLQKSDLRDLYPFPMLGVPMDQVVRFFATSGTTGPPVMFGFSRRDLDVLLPAQMARLMRTAGFRPGDKVYQGHGYGLWIGGPAVDIGLSALGCTNFPIGPGRAEQAVQWLRDQAYTGCFMSPIWLIHLARVAREQNMDPRRDWVLRVGIFGGQPISTGLRDEMEATVTDGFQAQISYGTTEAGGPIIGITCPYSHDSAEMHLINEDTLLTEIVDPETMVPVAPGEVGEIVITTLDKEASPVLRWRTRDLVRLSKKPYDCPCGRKGFPLIGLIIGRNDDMLKIRGAMVFPSQVEDVITATPGTIKDAWQIYIDRRESVLEEATVAFEIHPGANVAKEELRNSVARALSSRLGVRFNVECHEEGTLPRYEGKPERVLVR